MRALHRLAAGLALALAGCAAGPPARAPDARPPLTAAEIRALIRQVAEIRGLPERAPIPIALLDDAAFAAALRERLEDGVTEAEAERSAGFLVAFNLLPDLGGGARPSTAREVLEEQITAFYDVEARGVFVRAAPARTEDEAREQRGTLAHEIQHALQAQSFALPDLAGAPSEEVRLARLSALEGDAMVVMAAYIAAEQGAPIGRALRRLSDLSRTMPLEELARGEGHAALRGALPIARERLIFPYVAGMGLAADLYRAGGFPLVNQLLARPPASTEQVLHPEKYLAGEPPIPVRAPEPPPGYRVLESEPLGELQTRVVLERCAPAPEARAAAEGWGGDRFSVLSGPAREVALLWSSVWDTEQDAIELEAALRRSPACWQAPQQGAGAWAAGGALSIRREGARVAVVRGLPEPLAGAAAARLLPLAEPPAPPSPIGPYTIPARLPLPAPQRGYLQGDVYRSDWLGVVARIPPNVPATAQHKDLELRVGRDDVLVTGGMILSDRVTTPRFVELLLQEVAGGFAKAIDIEGLVVTGGGPSTHPLGPAIERSWSIAGTPVELRAVVVPVCNGTGSLVFIQSWSDPYAKTVLDGWLYSFRWLGLARLPVCEALDPR